jgi:hypothetical protein
MRDNKTKKNIKVGGFGWFSSKKKVDYKGQNNDITSKVDKLNQYDATGFKELKNHNNIQETVAKLETVSTIGSVGSLAVAAVGSTGFGLPIAGLMALALLLTNKMAEMYRSNLLLQLLMQDATFIIMDCYLLYDLIDISYQTLNKYEDPANDCKKEDISSSSLETTPEEEGKIKVKKFQINLIMQQQLKYQIEKLIKELLSLTETKIIRDLSEDPTLKSSGINSLVETEMAKRKKEYKYGFDKISRKFSRTFSGSYYITNINNSLTIINSYIILLKSNLDLTIKKFEILAPEKYKAIWKDILCSPEYNAYIKPILSEVLKDAEKDGQKVNQKELETALETIKLVDSDTSTSTSAPSSGGYKIKRRIKRKTMKK